jgi:hypothetical protein
MCLHTYYHHTCGHQGYNPQCSIPYYPNHAWSQTVGFVHSPCLTCTRTGQPAQYQYIPQSQPLIPYDHQHPAVFQQSVQVLQQATAAVPTFAPSQFFASIPQVQPEKSWQRRGWNDQHGWDTGSLPPPFPAGAVPDWVPRELKWEVRFSCRVYSQSLPVKA